MGGKVLQTAEALLQLTQAGRVLRPPRFLRRRAIDCVGGWKFDRFARGASHLIRALDEFNHPGIRFVSVQDNTDSPLGKATFTIIGAMAELESSLISERVQAGMQAAKFARIPKV